MTMGEYKQSDARTWAMLCHAATFAGYVVPFGNVIGPLVVWLLKKDTSALVDEHGKETINFQLSMTLYMLVAFALMVVLIGFVALPILIVLDLIVTIIAIMEASRGNLYRYPWTIRFVS